MDSASRNYTRASEADSAVPGQAAPSDTYYLVGMTRLATTAEALGLALFALMSGYACNQWAAARESSGLFRGSFDATFLPETCWVLAVAAQAALLTYVRRLPAMSLGLRRGHLERQVFWGITIGASALAVSYTVALGVSHMAGPPEDLQSPDWFFVTPPGRLLLLFGVSAVGTETLYRGLLLPRLCHAARSAVAGVVLCAILEAVPFWYGGYDWRTIACRIGVQFVTCTLYLRARSIVAAILGTFLYDAVGYVVVPAI